MDSQNKSEYFYPVENITCDIKKGEIIIIVDDRSPNNEGVFFQAAEKVTLDSINFFITHARGLIFLPCERERLNQLKKPDINWDGKPPSGAARPLAVSLIE